MFSLWKYYKFFQNCGFSHFWICTTRNPSKGVYFLIIQLETSFLVIWLGILIRYVIDIFPHTRKFTVSFISVLCVGVTCGNYSICKSVLFSFLSLFEKLTFSRSDGIKQDLFSLQRMSTNLKNLMFYKLSRINCVFWKSISVVLLVSCHFNKTAS